MILLYFFYNDEIRANPNEGVNIKVVSFSLLNSMYNVNEIAENNKFKIREIIYLNTITTTQYYQFHNYSVYSIMYKLNELLQERIQVIYNIATYSYTYNKSV
jgi:hypothetical protein